MVSRSIGTQFSLMIYDSDIDQGAEDFSVTLDLGSGDDFCVTRDLVFVIDL